MPARKPVKAGERFGRWVALSDGYYIDGEQYADFACDCGTKKTHRACTVRSKSSQSCGCLRSDTNTRNNRKPAKAGQRFGRWVITCDGVYVGDEQFAECVCDCGTKRLNKVANLRSGVSRSCGCFRGESVSLRRRKTIKAGTRFGRLVAAEDGNFDGARQSVYCVCDCGGSGTFWSYNLTSRQTTSCGCFHRQKASDLASRAKNKWASATRLYEGPQGIVWMRSSWEVAVAHRLDSDGLKWQYEPQCFSLGDNTRYTPDFLVSLGDLGPLWIEVKGGYFGRSREKIASFRATGRPLLVIDRANFAEYSGLSPSQANKLYPKVKAA
jgi:hypothetical protein